MNNLDAILFLETHQPFPPDSTDSGESLTDELSEKLYDAIKFFSLHYDERSVPLLLNCFGDGDGFSVYPYVIVAIEKYPANVVVPALVIALRNPLGAVRGWCSQVAFAYEKIDDRLISPLLEFLDDVDAIDRIYAVDVLERLRTENLVKELKERAKMENDPDVAAKLHALIRGWRQ